MRESITHTLLGTGKIRDELWRTGFTTEPFSSGPVIPVASAGAVLQVL
jgi:hypothetical protein